MMTFSRWARKSSVRTRSTVGRWMCVGHCQRRHMRRLARVRLPDVTPTSPHARRQLDLPVVLPRFRMLPDCLIEFIPGLALLPTSHPSLRFPGVGSYALQALGGDHASTERSVEDAVERPPVNEAVSWSRIGVVNRDHRGSLDVGNDDR